MIEITSFPKTNYADSVKNVEQANDPKISNSHEAALKIFTNANAKLTFSHPSVAYKVFKKDLNSSGLGRLGNKLIVPLRGIGALIKITCRTASTFFIGLPNAVFGDTLVLKKKVYTLARDLQELAGVVLTLVAHDYGEYLRQKSHFEKDCYSFFSPNPKIKKKIDVGVAQEKAEEFIDKFSSVNRVFPETFASFKPEAETIFSKPTFSAHCTNVNVARFFGFQDVPDCPRLKIDDRLLSTERVTAILMLAHKHRVDVRLKSLSMFGSDQSPAESWRLKVKFGTKIQAAERGLDLCVAFAKKCLESPNIDYVAMNEQLKRLGVEFCYLGGKKILAPPVLFESPETVCIHSLAGETKGVEHFVEKLKELKTVKNIKITGPGFKKYWELQNAKKADKDKETWGDYLKKFGNVTDCTADYQQPTHIHSTSVVRSKHASSIFDQLEKNKDYLDKALNRLSHHLSTLEETKKIEIRSYLEGKIGSAKVKANSESVLFDQLIKFHEEFTSGKIADQAPADSNLKSLVKVKFLDPYLKYYALFKKESDIWSGL